MEKTQALLIGKEIIYWNANYHKRQPRQTTKVANNVLAVKIKKKKKKTLRDINNNNNRQPPQGRGEDITTHHSNTGCNPLLSIMNHKALQAKEKIIMYVLFT